MCVRVRRLRIFIVTTVYELNLFTQDAINDRQVRYQRISTRLYIILIVSVLAVLGIYTYLSVNSYYETIFNPSEAQYIELQQNYSASLLCPCSSISIPYSIFMNIEPRFHQVCSSDFISLEWIYYNFRTNGISTHPLMDYRLSAGPAFHTLSTICQEANQTVERALAVFLQTHFVTSQILSQQFFQSQSNSLIQNWKSTTIYQYRRTIQLTQALARGNRLNNGHLDVAYKTDVTSRETKVIPQMYGNCSCGLSACRTPIGIYEFDLFTNDFIEILEVPKLYIGCYALDVLFASTLECYYNLSCMIELDRHLDFPLGPTFNFSPLNPILNSPNQTIQSIIDNLMIDEWLLNVSFTSYYKACAPLTCTFENKRRISFFFVLTTIVSLFGGLSLGLQILIVLILRLIDKIMNGCACPRPDPADFIRRFFTFHDEPRLIRHLYFLLITAALCSLYMVSAFRPRSITAQIPKPSIFKYQDIAIHYPESIQCTCSQISIKYGLFLTITPQFHQVCSSEFVSDRWIAYIYDESNFTQKYPSSDFRYSASAQFQLLASLCQLAQETVNITLTALATSDFINAELLSKDSLYERIQMTVDQIKTTMPNSYLTTLSLIRETTGANMLMGGPASAWVYDTPNIIVDGAKAYTKSLIYNGCSCGFSSKCVQPSRGMFAGCYPVEALLQSTLHCFYDQQCIDSNNIFQAMNSSSLNASRFSINATIESIVNQLMIEQYSRDLFYEKYFDQCAPSSCSYSYTDKVEVIEGLTLLIGLYGGLVIICRVIAVIIVKLFCHQPRRVNPINIS